MRKFLIAAGLAVILLTLWQSGPSAAAASRQPVSYSPPVNGTMDIRELAFAKDSQSVNLQGQWAFYPRQLRTPDDLRRDPGNPSSIEVPSSWPAYGYGTYRLQIRIPDADIGANKALFLRSINSASRIWIDGRDMGGLGQVGTSLETERPQSHLNLVFFQPRQATVDIVIQASNFSFREGGMTREVLYGDTGVLIPYILKEMLYEVVVIGGFLLIGLYHLLVFAIRKRDRSALFVGFVALAVSLHTLILNGYLSSTILGLNDWERLVKLEYILELAALLAVVLLMRNLYPLEVHRTIVVLSFLISAALFLFVLLTPARVYTESMLPQTIVKGFILLYFIFYVGVKAYLNRREGAIIHLAALLLIVSAIVNDTLYFLRVIETTELLRYGAVPFILAQAVIVSYRHARLSVRNDELLEELTIANNLLEQKVESRTRSLYEANEQRTLMLATIAHDLGTPLVGIQTHLQLMIQGKAPMDRPEIHRQLLDKTTYMRHLIQNLFELSKLESGKMQFHFETVAVEAWSRGVMERFRAELAHKNFKLHGYVGNLPADARIRIDRSEILRVLQNYIDNACKFSAGIHDTIELRVSLQCREAAPGECLLVEVADRGAGMSKEVQDQAFDRFYRARDKQAEGSGLGLAIVKEIVKQHRGEVGVFSAPGEGSTFYFTLPLVT